ncbi:MAG TPA: MarR family transcriptional regulator [Gemmatimonadales bacterium]|nr:MarR family transcriptional regulator [Gemmatimonadales bacterium]
MGDPRASNLLGALAVALGDEISTATEGIAGHAAAGPAAIVTVGGEPGQTIESLRRALDLSHSGTVRLLDRLEAEGIVERQAGKDGRSVAVFLTSAGKRVYQRILDARRQSMDAALGYLGSAERTQFMRLVEKLLYGITRSPAHSDHICRLCELDVCPEGTCPVNCAALARS